MPRKGKANLGPGAGSGGARQGTPGKAYANRTDLAQDMMPLPEAGTRTPASGGMGQSGEDMLKAAQNAPRPIYADDFPNLKDPTTRPSEPVTAGLPTGPGPGPSDQRRADAQAIKQWLPLLEPLTQDPSTPDSVRQFVNFIRSV